MLTVLVAFLAFAVVHSLTAGLQPKKLLTRFLPERFVLGWYRLFYNIFAVMTFLPVMAMVALLPSQSLWAVPMPWAIGLILLQGIGAIGLLISIIQIDVLRFAGLKQVIAYLNASPLPLPEEPLVANGVYSLMRHPLYFFGLLFIWPSPTMSTTQLAFNLGITAYVIIGSRIEEHRMSRVFGEEYEDYKKKVAWLLPIPKG